MKEDIIEGNAIIAEFMEHRHFDSIKGNEVWYWNASEKTQKQDDYISRLKYHSSWDWLMPVWYKYRDLKFNEEAQQKLHCNYCARLANNLAYGTIEEFFNTLTIAIKWYNKQEYLNQKQNS